KGFLFETPTNLNRLYNVYMLADNKLKMAEVLEQLINIQPDGANYARLAAVYKEMGKYNEALAAVQKAVELDPSLKAEAEKFIQMLNQ
ncbi:tetratricopeptide repeat protein, partial [Candidatus Parcubacteria bacterium]|nr:tetratricopeptide repeat protein [Candidatus Parcubacteria bacterium]